VQERPSVRLVRTHRFRRAYRKLDARYRELVKKTLAPFVADPTYPGLRVEHIQGTDGIWEMRAGREIRITFEIREGQGGHARRRLAQRRPRRSYPLESLRGQTLLLTGSL
jgi:mRNA-degrading endonuclease RelE of RelBE toxin-antitoxin system